MSKLRREWLLIIIPAFIASLTLFWGLDSVVKNLVNDERSFFLASDLLRNESYYPYLIFPNNIGTTHTLLPYLMQIPLNIFGYNVFGLRFTSAFFGLLGVITFFFLLKNLAKNLKVALLGSVILGITHWHIAVSRVMIEISEVLFFSIFNLLILSFFISSYQKEQYFKIKSLRLEKSLVFIFLTGLTFGLVQHTYQSARFYVLFYILFFPLFWFLKRTNWKKILLDGFVFSVGFIIVLSPLILVYFQHPDYFDSRRGELVFSQGLSSKDFIWSLKQSTLRTLGMFHFQGYDVSCYNIPGKPMLDILSGWLMLVGAFVSFKFIKKEFNLILWLFFFVSLLPSIFSYWPATPHGLRAAGVIIPTVAWIAFGAHKFAELFKKRYFIILAVVLLIIGFFNIKNYFFDLASLQGNCFKYPVETFDSFKDKFLMDTNGVKFIR